MSNLKEILFEEDQKKVVEAVKYHPMGSYQLGEVARLSALLYGQGFNVVKHLEKLLNE